jgi:hypothetical protein
MPVEPSAACLDSEDNKLYVASEESACVAVLDCSRDSVLTILRSLRPSRYAQTVCYVPGWGRVYCCDYDDSSVVVIDCKADTILARVRTPPRPTTLCYNDANGRVYVLTEEDGGPVGIDVASNVVVSNADCFGATPLCCNARDNKLYGLHGSQKVGVYDCSTDSLVASVHTMGDPVYLLYSPSAHKVYCASIYG